jgi:hypothetical protein
MPFVRVIAVISNGRGFWIPIVQDRSEYFCSVLIELLSRGEGGIPRRLSCADYRDYFVGHAP